jgi:hypothetical protein
VSRTDDSDDKPPYDECVSVFSKGTLKRIYLGNRQTALPRHGTDIGPYLINKILKDLGIEKEKK